MTHDVKLILNNCPHDIGHFLSILTLKLYKKNNVVCVPMRQLFFQVTMYKNLTIIGQNRSSTESLGSHRTASYNIC